MSDNPLIEGEIHPWETVPPMKPGQWAFCDGCRWQEHTTAMVYGINRPGPERCTNPQMRANGGPGVRVPLRRAYGFLCGGVGGCKPSWLEVSGCDGRELSNV